MLEKDQLLYLSKKQEELDSYIMNSQNLTLNDEIDNMKLVALLVELSEFINECRAFKFWSKKPPSDKSVILEEFVDGLHFIISIGNDIMYNFSNFEYKNNNNKDLNEWSIEVYNMVMNFYNFKSHKNYQIMFNSFLNCLRILNYTTEDVLDSYNLKNATNFKRQDNNY
ncbi:dUTP diphosphatase [Spiroplasma turonicum]|uniref:dUTP diphosphatase n=1 Tax=Spiroplasma turonicum TaxID=216946 RepID=A0A0K1P5L0_9MOLU|nr:dUTP diphosphatase [Spiroplasma turonicum]AKU79469.1 dUTP diphosphatase [Spiroplasma turonicum]ALX70491.1 dUTP diphosphatase [Spiroplasma turonicum]